MSDRILADLDPNRLPDDRFAPVLYHVGDAATPLKRWRQLLQGIAPRGWPDVRSHAKHVMQLIANDKILFTAAMALRANGPKAPGPNFLPLEGLDQSELWKMCSVLSQSIHSDTYRPGPERVVWLKKTSGRGRRPIVVGNVQDRVVAKAAALVLRPMLDMRFDPLRFAFRATRTREQALSLAGMLADRYPIWLPHDLKDAFGRVPLDRLLDVVRSWLPCPRLIAFLRRILPPQSRELRGLKQGSPLSPLMLELYLTHVLHEPWRKDHQPSVLLRYADDILVVSKDRQEAISADDALRKRLTPSGMLLKHSYEDAVVDIRDQSAEWLGFSLRSVGKKFTIHLAPNAFLKLSRRFSLAHAKCRSAERAQRVLRHWFDQLGPCYRWVDRDAMIQEGLQTANAYGFEELPEAFELKKRWGESKSRWRSTQRRVRNEPGYLVPGPLVPPTPTSVIV